MTFVNDETPGGTQEVVEFAKAILPVSSAAARVRIVAGGVSYGEHGTKIFLLPRLPVDGESESAVEITDLVSRVEWVHDAGVLPAVALTLLLGAADIYADRLALVQGKQKTALDSEINLD